MSSENGIRLQIAVLVFSVLHTIAMFLGAYVLYDIHDRVVRLENVYIGGKNDAKKNPDVSDGACRLVNPL